VPSIDRNQELYAFFHLVSHC